MSDRQIEMLWPCSCGKKNLGRHMKCETCGRPKDENVEYEMPDVETAATVTDEKLLRMATAGENWHCAYCNSDQRALDGSCGQCGAGRSEKATQAHAAAHAAPLLQAQRKSRSPLLFVAIVLGCVFLLGTCVWVVSKKSGAHPQPDLPVAMAVTATSMPEAKLTVSGVHWTRIISRDHWQLVDREGFDPPSDAVDKKRLGDHVHHQEQVLDHMETVYDDVQVPDGTRSESYTEHVSCGQNCTTTPRSCRQSCKSNKNGFASCTDVCTGGNQSCTTKYCDETRTRQVPKTRTDHRARQEPRYRSEPRYAPWFSYKEMDWVQIATIQSEGDDLTLAWPDASAPAQDAGKQAVAARVPDSGVADRERRTETFQVTLTDPAGASYEYDPASADELQTFAKGSPHTMHVQAGRAFPMP